MNRTEKQKIEVNAMKSIAKYLNSIGWSCLVGGFEGIEQEKQKYKFKLIFSFVGKKVRAKIRTRFVSPTKQGFGDLKMRF